MSSPTFQRAILLVSDWIPQQVLRLLLVGFSVAQAISNDSVGLLDPPSAATFSKTELVTVECAATLVGVL